ncbi:MAG: HxlR family transcriptional regulator [Gammaproteobacteria bacterium]|jgi:DNA-binding HxlR family transcriptional regulator|nr:HxlR family transcriptional regulator [Gammaproteobacteria bacterium]
MLNPSSGLNSKISIILSLIRELDKYAQICYIVSICILEYAFMKKEFLNPDCPIGVTIKVLGGKWKLLILFSLNQGTKRFNELRREMPAVTQRMLTTQLRELEADKIISRKVYPEVPPRVEYALTDMGKTLTPVLEALKKWGACYIRKVS